MAKEYPDLYTCACEVGKYLYTSYGWKCNQEEILYLMLHINRVQDRKL